MERFIYEYVTDVGLNWEPVGLDKGGVDVLTGLSGGENPDS